MKYPQLERLIEIVATLRGENGCQWDREQTHKSLRPNMIEEAYEAVDAIDDENMDNLREELGDVLLQVVLHSQIADDNNEFNIQDVAKMLNDKFIASLGAIGSSAAKPVTAISQKIISLYGLFPESGT